MLKILQARLQQYVNRPDVQAGFRNGRGTRDQIALVANSDPQMKVFVEAKLSIHMCLHIWGSCGCGHSDGTVIAVTS